ncbi:MAG: 2-hydroxychromene-2-carboxylate isomerase [Myxococcota bacterium]
MSDFEFLFDFGSPTSYLAWTQIPKIEEAYGVRAKYIPILLGAVHKASGNTSPVTVAAKNRWMGQDLARFAARYEVPLTFNPHFPINTLLLMRGATALLDTAEFHPYLDAMFRGMWVDGANLNDPNVLGSSLAEAGLDPGDLLQRAQDQTTKDRLRELTENAVARGVFGAPTFFVGDEMHFGQDRLDFVRAKLAQ